MRLRTPDEIEQTDPLRARYVRILTQNVDPIVAMRTALNEIAEQGQQSLHLALFAYCRRLVQEDVPTQPATPFAVDGGPLLAADAAVHCTTAWSLLAAGRGDGLSVISTKQRANGAFFHFDGNAGDNPEPWWFHELVLLHAITSHAMLSGDAAAMAASRRATAFHHAETQPDHATNQPWAIHAFLADAEFTPTADLMLLAANVQQPDGLGNVSRLLLADAAICLSVA